MEKQIQLVRRLFTLTHGVKEGKAEFKKEYGAVLTLPYSEMHSILRDTHETTITLFRELKRDLPNLTAVQPVWYDKARPSEIQVYRGIKLSWKHLQGQSRGRGMNFLELSRVLSATQDAHKKVPAEALTKRILTPQTEGMFGYLLKRGLNETQCKQFIQNLMPPTLEYATTIEEMRHVIHACKAKSCTNPAGGTARTTWGNLSENANGALPTDFYAICPQTSMAYLKRGDNVLARTVLITIDTNKYYVRVFASCREEREFMQGLLAAEGWDPVPRSAALTQEFNFEGLPSKSVGPLFPMPYTDWNFGNMRVFWEDNLFKVRIDSASPRTDRGYVLPLGSNVGFVTVDMACRIRKTCAYCAIEYPTTAVFSKEGQEFCSTECSRYFGYVPVKEKTGDITVQLKDSRFLKVHQRVLLYLSGPAVVKQFGYLPYIEKVAELETGSCGLYIARNTAERDARICTLENPDTGETQEVAVGPQAYQVLSRRKWVWACSDNRLITRS